MYREIGIGIESIFLKKKLELGLSRGELVINPPQLDLIFKTTNSSKIMKQELEPHQKQVLNSSYVQNWKQNQNCSNLFFRTGNGSSSQKSRTVQHQWRMQTFIAQFNNFLVFSFVVSAKVVLGYINATPNLPLK